LAREGLGFCEFLLPHSGKVSDFRTLFSLPQRGKVPAQQADEVYLCAFFTPINFDLSDTQTPTAISFIQQVPPEGFL
ncbi:MAG: hypothetical protein J6B77_02225, partial [Clostridia bacterium]|nr:hypothetical protein [Clostridia bacterium]